MARISVTHKGTIDVRQLLRTIATDGLSDCTW